LARWFFGIFGSPVAMTDPTAAEFLPAWWCRGPHAQTLWPILFRSRPRLRLTRERIELPDGDFVDLDWNENQTGPIVIVLHGLEGSSKSIYARGLLKALQEAGWRGVVMHQRGCSGEPNRLPRSYHSGETADFAHVLRTLRQREPNTVFAAVGYSLGGNALLKWLGETRDRESLRAAVAVSVPFLLNHAARRMAQGFSRLYQWELLRRLHRSLRRKRARMDVPLAIPDVERLRTFREFDEYVTAPLHGFNGADHYYSACSSRAFLKGIVTPTLIVHAIDDPFMAPDTPPTRAELSEDVRFELYRHGGHVGFVAGPWPWRPSYWLEHRIPDFLSEYLVPRSISR
jgi:hypothetical protein